MKELHTLSVMVVEDSKAIRSLIVNILKKNGIGNITQAGNGKQALDAAPLIRPDLIISDLVMPEMNGMQLLANLQKHPDLKAIPFVVLTSKTDDMTFKKTMTMGAADYIRKPFGEKELMIKLKSVAEWLS
ncbi:MAG: response regulator [Desulfobacterales bacterium]|nr:response regulator [Desulfobacterales bacterium]